MRPDKVPAVLKHNLDRSESQDLSYPNRGGHVEDVADVVQCEVVGVLRGKLVPNEDVRVDLVHPLLVPAKVSRPLGSHHLVTLLGSVGLRSIEVVIRLAINLTLYTLQTRTKKRICFLLKD